MRIKCLCALVLVVGLVRACGISLHNEVTIRAMHLFRPSNPDYSKYSEYIARNPQFVQPGSFFPDWGYSCLNNRDASEEAHWPQFIKVFVEFIREKYQTPWDQNKESQEIIAFLFAVTSHGAADIPWHSFGMQSGFIKAMAGLNFDKNYETAHSVADRGGEFTLSHMTDLNYLENSWKVPLDAIKEVYGRMNFTVRVDVLDFCIRTAFEAQQANKKLGKLFFGHYGSKSPFLVEQLEEYHRGGINDMSANVHDCWYGLSEWFENGPKSLSSLCNIFSSVVDMFPRPTYNTKHLPSFDFLQSNPKAILASMGYRVTSYIDENGIGHYELKPLLKKSHHQLQIKLEKLKNLELHAHGLSADWNKLVNGIHAEDALNVLDFRLKATDEKRLSKDPCKSLPKDSNAAHTLGIPYPYASLGHDMAIGDFNGDGILDIAISAPHYSHLPDISQIGAVFIFYGQRNYARVQKSHVTEMSDQTLYGYDEEPQSRFGWSMTIVDLNKDGFDDLVVSAPGFQYSGEEFDYPGKVYVYFGHKGGLSTIPDVQIEASKLPLAYDIQIEELGQVLASDDIDNDGFKDLLIGCPRCGNAKQNVFQNGVVFAFLSSSDHTGNRSITESDWSLFSNHMDNYEWFGSAIGVLNSRNKTTILIGAPGSHHQSKQMAGRLYGYQVHLSDSDGDSFYQSKPKPPVKIFDLSGSETFQGLGSSIATGDFYGNGLNLIALGSPSETAAKRFSLNRWQAGAVRIINQSRLREGLSLSELEMESGGILERLHGQGPESSSHFGSALHWDGDSLWISEPFGNWEAGRIYRYKFKTQFGSTIVDDGDYEKYVYAEEECIAGGEAQTRFGNRILNGFDFNGDGKPDLAIAAEHPSGAARLSGSVTFIFG